MIAIIDYNMGNLRSVFKAIESLGGDAKITKRPSEIERADQVILPGVGAFSEAMKNLRKTGLMNIIRHQALIEKKPLLGICLGMQLLAEIGYEVEKTEGLGLISGSVVKFDFPKGEFRLPHVGWNNISEYDRKYILFRNLSESELYFYFVHSYHFAAKNSADVAGWCDYGIRFAAAVNKDNVYGVQFHPEKSQRSGLKLLTNFMEL